MSAAAPPESGSATAHRDGGPGPGDFAWRVLQLLNGFRLIIAAVLSLFFWAVQDPRIIGEFDPTTAAVALNALLVVGLIEIPLLHRRLPGVAAQLTFQFVFDMLAFAALIHASGGITSGLGGLLIVSTGSLALLLPARQAFLLAAFATLVLLGEQTVALLQGLTTNADYAPAGILGAVMFVITGIVQLYRERMVQTEALAQQRGVDLQNLVELNDYIIQHLRESIVVVDQEDRIRLINESAAKLLATTGSATGQELDSISPALALYLDRWRGGGTEGKPLQFAAGSEEGSHSIQPHFSPLGGARTEGVVIFLEDTSLISERVQQMKLAALGRLSASIAHEIRNPLGALSHAGQLLAESDRIGTDDQKLTDIIRVNSRRVSQIVDSVLSLSRSDRTEPEKVELKQWARDFATEFTNTQELFEEAVAVDPASDEVTVEIDRTHLHQVVWNLCENAVKYASQAAGAISVELSCGVLESSGRPFLAVADRGPGIAPELAEQIFEPFHTGQPGGTGLGLYISRELCERNRATLRYQPRPDGGSVFRIVFADPQRWKDRRA